MKKTLIGCGIVAAIGFFFCIFIYSMIKGYNNDFNLREQKIVLQDKRRENIHNDIFQEMKAKGFITDADADKQMEAIKLNMNAPIPAAAVSQGMLGSLAVTRATMPFNEKFYENLMKSVEHHQKDFKDAQDKKLVLIAQYKKVLNDIPNKWFASWLGFPSKNINLEEQSEVIGSKATKDTWKTKQMDVINPIPEKTVVTPEAPVTKEVPKKKK